MRTSRLALCRAVSARHRAGPNHYRPLRLHRISRETTTHRTDAGPRSTGAPSTTTGTAAGTDLVTVAMEAGVITAEQGEQIKTVWVGHLQS